MSFRALTRNDVSLDTGPNRDQHYDQICALSAKTINKNFEYLWEQRPEMKKPLTFETDDPSIGLLKATMKPPRIMIEPNQEVSKEPVVYYSLCIDKGDIYYTGSPTVNIDNWVITVVASLNSMIASPNDQMTEDAQWKAQDALDELTHTYTLPERDPNKPVKMRAGEYSIHRLFAAISETRWKLADPQRSTVRVGSEDVPLSRWENESPENTLNADKVRNTLGKWAALHHYSAFFTLGLEVSVPNPLDDPYKPYFTPTGLRLQNYPYIEDSDYIQYKKRNETPKGLVDVDYNCLLWCEVVDRSLPNTELLNFSGNLAMPADPSKNIPEEVAGTFVLDRRLFFEKYLLPELQEFCVATQIIPLEPTMKTDYSKKGVESCVSIPNVAVGNLPDNLDAKELARLPVKPPKSAKDDYYKFKQNGPFDWVWSKTLEAPGSGHDIHYYGDDAPATPIYRKYKTVSEMTVKMTRKPGTSTLILTSENNYRHWEGYYNNQNFDWDSKEGTDKVLWGEFFVKAKWSIEINLAPKGVENINGIITPTIEKVNETTWLPHDFDVEVPKMQYVLANADGDMKERIHKCLAVSIPHVVETLQNNFQGDSRFRYPGTGTLKFGPPLLSDNGQVYCNIDYLPLKKGLLQLRLPSAKFPLTYDPDRQSHKGPITGGPPPSGNLPRIQWTPSIKYDSEKHRAKLTLVAENKIHDAAAFSRIKITMCQVKKNDSYGLFNEPVWEQKVEKKPPAPKPKKDPKKDPKKNPKVDPATKPVPGTTPAPGTTPGLSNVMTTELMINELARVDMDPAILAGHGSADTNTGAEAGSHTQTPPEPKPEVKPEIPKPDDPKPDTDPETDTDTDPEPEPEKETWSLTSNNIISGIYIKNLTVRASRLGMARLLEFAIIPEGHFKRDPRFILQADEKNPSTFTLELEGTVEKSGTYVLKLAETWSSSIMTENPVNTEIAESWYSVTIEDGKPEGKFEWITQDQAEIIQGIKPAPGPPVPT